MRPRSRRVAPPLPRVTDNDILSLGVPDMVRSLASGELSSVAITSAYLDLARDRNPEINCYIRIEPDSALASAEQADAARRRGNEVHPLCGMPIAIKDIFHRRGIPVSAGSGAHPIDSGPDATVVRRLRQAGMPVLGILNLDEFAAGGSGINAHFGRCLNPVNHRFLSGGSSSGSAAAVGARMAPWSLGSDAGGSVRLPAGWCGVTGLKPTYGQVPRTGVIPRTWSMDCIGPLAGDAASCALLLELIAGEDGRDSSTLPGRQSFTPLPEVPDRSLRVGVDRGIPETIGRHQGAALSRAEAVFRDMGLGIAETVLPDIEPLNQLHQVVVKCEGAAYLAPLLSSDECGVSESVRHVVREGYEIPAAAYLSALRLRLPMLQGFLDSVFGNADAILLPLCPDDVPASDHPDIQGLFARSARFTRFVNYLGLPAIAFPVCLDGNGMPVSVQLLGKPRDEFTLLSLADAFGRVSGRFGEDM